MTTKHAAEPPPIEPFTPEQAAAIDRRARAESEQAGGAGNVLKIIEDHGPPRIKELRARRDRLMAEVRAINSEMSDLETHMLIHGPRTNGNGPGREAGAEASTEVEDGKGMNPR